MTLWLLTFCQPASLVLHQPLPPLSLTLSSHTHQEGDTHAQRSPRHSPAPQHLVGFLAFCTSCSDTHSERPAAAMATGGHDTHSGEASSLDGKL